MKTVTRVLPALLAASLAFAAAAQDKVLREGQVTERALVDALAPAAAASAGEEPMRMRSFRPAVRPAAVAGATAATGAVAAGAQGGRASILVTFVTDSAELTGRAKSALDVLAGAMKSERLAGVRFTIEGHADPRGGDEHNMKLSTARAEAVRQYLITHDGLPAERLDAVGKGATELMNTSNVTAPENRRVTIVSKTS